MNQLTFSIEPISFNNCNSILSCAYIVFDTHGEVIEKHDASFDIETYPINGEKLTIDSSKIHQVSIESGKTNKTLKDFIENFAKTIEQNEVQYLWAKGFYNFLMLENLLFPDRSLGLYTYANFIDVSTVQDFLPVEQLEEIEKKYKKYLKCASISVESNLDIIKKISHLKQTN